MKRSVLTPIVLLSLVACPGAAQAREGMWTPAQLSAIAKDLKANGLEIPAPTLSDLEKGPLAAVINFSWCTASFVSPDGLFVTNHHCGIGAVQRSSTEQRNLVEDGFVAPSRTDELWAGPAYWVRVTVSEKDVTGPFQKALRGAKSDEAAFKVVDRLKKKLVAACEKDVRMRCTVATYDGGARYVLIEQLNIRDVRLVHAPPRRIGKFGGDVDNWMWPRHTGDWSLFRAYVGKSGAPAEHTAENVPYRPKRWLEVSTQGVDEGGLVMVAGYPHSTSRYRTADELKHAAEVAYPETLRTLTDMLAIVRGQRQKSPDARIKLGSTRDWMANYQKYAQGLIQGLGRTRAVQTSKARDEGLLAWVGADPARKARFHAGLTALGQTLARERATWRRDLLLKWLMRVSVPLRTAATLHWLAVQRTRPDAERDAGYQKRDEAELKGGLEHAWRSYVPEADQALVRYLVAEANKLPKEVRIDGLALYQAMFDSVDPVSALYEDMEIDDPKRRAFLFGADRDAVEASKDRFLGLAKLLYPERAAADRKKKAHQGAMARLRPVRMAALRARSTTELYPDANATLRVTYGTIRGYSAQEAVQYTPFTSLHGILEKDTGKDPFDVSARQRAAIEALHASPPQKPWVRGGSVPVNFLTD